MKVIDASVALKWVFEEEDGVEAARRLLRNPEELTAPALWLVEAGSALWRRHRRALISVEEATAGMSFLREVPVLAVDTSEVAESALRLALELGHPIYDCTYLALALREELPLVTADQKFAARLQRSGYTRLLELIGPDQP